MILSIFLTVTLSEFLIGLILDQILSQGGILLLHISKRNRRNAINIICIIISYISIFMHHIMNKILLSPTKYFGHFRFSTIKILEDWEYVSQIQKKLKENNINEAMSYLINSHLNGLVLDRQTFYNLYTKMKQLNSALSYQELLYKLYRQSFSPHALVVDWMQLISQSKDKKLLDMLSNDFKSLNIEAPKQLTQNMNNKQPELQEQQSQKQQKKTRGRKKPHSPQSDKPKSPQKQSKTKQNKYHVTYDNVSVQYTNNQINNDPQVQKADQNINQSELITQIQQMLKNVKQITIQKIQLIPLTQDKQNKPNKPSPKP